MARKQQTLADVTLKKPGRGITTQSSKEDLEEKRKRVTARLTEEAWKEFKFLTVELDRSSQDLFIEAINDLLSKYDRRPIA